MLILSQVTTSILISLYYYLYQLLISAGEFLRRSLFWVPRGSTNHEKLCVACRCRGVAFILSRDCNKVSNPVHILFIQRQPVYLTNTKRCSTTLIAH